MSGHDPGPPIAPPRELHQPRNLFRRVVSRKDASKLRCLWVLLPRPRQYCWQGNRFVSRREPRQSREDMRWIRGSWLRRPRRATLTVGAEPSVLPRKVRRNRGALPSARGLSPEGSGRPPNRRCRTDGVRAWYPRARPPLVTVYRVCVPARGRRGATALRDGVFLERAGPRSAPEKPTPSRFVPDETCRASGVFVPPGRRSGQRLPSCGGCCAAWDHDSPLAHRGLG